MPLLTATTLRWDEDLKSSWSSKPPFSSVNEDEIPTVGLNQRSPLPGGRVTPRVEDVCDRKTKLRAERAPGTVFPCPAQFQKVGRLSARQLYKCLISLVGAPGLEPGTR
jgi:hypothetical protein